MKKYLILILLVLILLVGCDTIKNSEANKETDVKEQINSGNSETIDKSNNTTNDIIDNKNIIEIREKMFIAQIEDIYYNFEDFKDKYIKVEGMYSVFEPENEDGKKVHFVYRNAPGCCGNDGWAGFMLNYDGEYPNHNDWVKVIGTPEIVKDGVFEDLYLNVISIEVMNERGTEYVNQ